ncbi:L-sulfolactate dehydrogenase [Sphaerisporangium flaviroseum]|uniref:L-sulfolactate dehydrogenase n=1 Tax=Sphaerisporangium flaviroseum TaxID=509199 RepID=A0ABP7IZY3_9ACTN
MQEDSVRTSLDELKQMMRQVLSSRGITGEDAEFVIDDHVDAELEGRPTHGLGKFLLIDHALDNRQGGSEVVSSVGCLMIIDGHREIGQLAARFASLKAADLARRCGVGLVTLRNFGRFGRLAPYSRIIAETGMVGIVLNNAGPPAVAPFGSRNAILGTNPISFGFPSVTTPVVIDFATSKKVWGEIRQATLSESQLPRNAFLDGNGNETVEPAQVDAVLPFGEHKGSALCLAIELLAGTVAGAAMGGQVDDEYSLGAMFLAVNPVSGAHHHVSALVDEIVASIPMQGADNVQVPGQGSLRRKGEGLQRGWLDVADSTYKTLSTMAKGGTGLTSSLLSN